MCDCIGELNAKLASYDIALVTTLFGTQKTAIETYKVRSSRKRPPKVVATFCPFCGEKYAEPNATRISPAYTPARQEMPETPPPGVDPEHHKE